MGGPPKPQVDQQVQAQREIARQDRINTIQDDVGDLTRSLALRFGAKAAVGSQAGGSSLRPTFQF